jgi:ribose transport system substrate-binding protein
MMELKMKKIIAVFISGGFLYSCGSDDSNIATNDGGSESVNKTPTVALVMKSLANEFFVNMAAGAEAHHSENSQDYELIVNGIRNESNLAQQVALVDQMISSGVDAIVIAPADSRALVPALARAESAGIVVINIDNRLEPEILAEYDLQIPFIGPSNLAGAKMVGDFALEGLASDSEVAILEGITSAFNSIQRRTGFERAVAEAGMEVVTLQSAEWDQTRAAQVTAAILSQFPELDVILAANDNMALGAASAVGVAALGREITIAGFDNISAIHPLIKSGTVIATVDQFGDQLAVFGIEYALEVLATGIVPEDRETSLELINTDSL